MLKAPKTIPEQLADAAMMVARANHYMVGLNPPEYVTWEQFHEGYLILVDRELAFLRQMDERTWQRGYPMTADRMMADEFEWAFDVLNAACRRAHNQDAH